MNSLILNALEIINEAVVLVIGYLFITLSDLVSDDTLKYNVGWVIVGITLLNIFINWVSLVGSTIYFIVKAIRGKCISHKHHKKLKKDVL